METRQKIINAIKEHITTYKMAQILPPAVPDGGRYEKEMISHIKREISEVLMNHVDFKTSKDPLGMKVTGEYILIHHKDLEAMLDDIMSVIS